MKIRYISFSIQLIELAVSSGLSVADSASNTVDSNAGRIYNIKLESLFCLRMTQLRTLVTEYHSTRSASIKGTLPPIRYSDSEMALGLPMSCSTMHSTEPMISTFGTPDVFFAKKIQAVHTALAVLTFRRSHGELPRVQGMYLNFTIIYRLGKGSFLDR